MRAPAGDHRLVAVQHGHPQEVDLQQHQRAGDNRPEQSMLQKTAHGFVF
jgi:hypothetical protein